MPRDRARDRNETMLSKQIVSEDLLSGAGNARAQPVGIGHVSRIDNMDIASIGNDSCRHPVRHGVERPEPVVDRDFKDRRRGIERAVDRANPLAVPAAANPIGAFSAIPSRRMDSLIEPPRDQLGPAERDRQKGHA